MVRTPGFPSKGHFQSHLTSPAGYLAAFPLLPHSVLGSSKVPSFFPGCPTPESSPGSSAWPPPSLHLACDPLPLGHWPPLHPFSSYLLPTYLPSPTPVSSVSLRDTRVTYASPSYTGIKSPVDPAPIGCKFPVLSLLLPPEPREVPVSSV